jgi:hypothetical protein
MTDLDWVLANLEQAPRRSDPHHITGRGAGGSDTADNCIPLCREHHNEVEAPFKGMGWMLKQYPALVDWLERAGRYDVLERYGGKEWKR